MEGYMTQLSPRYLVTAFTATPPSTSSPRVVDKLPARHRRTRIQASTQTSCKRSCEGNKQWLSEPQHGHEAFRSRRVEEEVARLEKESKTKLMTPEDAFVLLQHLLLATSSETCDFTVSSILDEVKQACWQTIPSSNSNFSCPSRTKPSDISISTWLSPRKHETQSLTEDTDSRRTQVVGILYSTLFRGVEECIMERKGRVQSLRKQLQQLVEQNNQLPKTIRDREAAIKSSVTSFIASSVQSLNLNIPLTAVAGRNAEVSDDSTIIVGGLVDEKLQTLRRRKELREWACNDLSVVINDHMTRVSELKKVIMVTVGEIKKEELNTKMKAKRLKNILQGFSASNSSVTTPESELSKSNGLPLATGHVFPSSMTTTTSKSTHSAKERLALAQERTSQLRGDIEQRKQYIRTRTEEVFEVRNKTRELERQKNELVTENSTLEKEIGEIERSCTPRPNWAELKNSVTVTTAVDRVDKKAKMRLGVSQKRMHSRNGRSQQHSNDNSGADEDVEHTEDQLNQILCGNWSTVEKVHAMATELARIRSKYDAGDAISTEQAKLNNLQHEIAMTLQKLEAVKAKASSEC